MSSRPQSQPPPSTPPSEPPSYKRKRDFLQAQLSASSTGGPKNKEIIANQVSMGRGLRRIVDMFHLPSDLVEAHDRNLEMMAEGNGEDELGTEDGRKLRSYNKLVAQVPLVKTLFESGDVESLEALYRNLRIGADGARSDDTGRLKIAVVSWVNDLYGASNPALRANSKDERGLENNHTGRLLCPSEFSWDDLVVRAKIREGHADFLVTADLWPLFLYKGYSCDTNDLEHGLFRSKILLQAFMLLFTSPSSATKADEGDDDHPPPAKRVRKTLAPTRSNVASLIGLHSVTGRSIAYAATQLRFSLSNGGSWRIVDIDFHHDEFYTAIVDYFEVIPGPVAQARVDDLLAWWNTKIFGRDSGNAPLARRSGASISKLAAQRKAREAAPVVPA